METCSVVLTFESVDEILWCDHSNETFLAVLLHGTNCISLFFKMKCGIFLGVKRLWRKGAQKILEWVPVSGRKLPLKNVWGGLFGVEQNHKKTPAFTRLESVLPPLNAFI